MSETHRGEQVILRAFGDEPVVRRIWATDKQSVLVCDDDQYARKLQGEDFDLLGFPAEFVYAFDPRAVNNGVLNEPRWWLKLSKLIVS